MQALPLAQPARPPVYPGGLLFGCAPEIHRDTLAMVRRVAQLGDVVELPLGLIGRLTQHPAYIALNHPDHIHHVMVNRQNYGRQSPVYEPLREVIGLSLSTSEGEYWVRHRRIMQPSFHREVLRSFIPAMVAAVEELAQRWLPNARSGEPVDVWAEMLQITLRIVGRTLLSTDILDDTKELGASVMIAEDFVRSRINSPVDLPRWITTPRRRRFLNALRQLDKIVFELIDRRRRTGQAGADLLGQMMAARDPETGTSLSDQELRDELMTIFLAGHETTAVTLTWVFYVLSQHPEIEARVRDELSRVLSGRPPTVEDLKALEYMDRVINETLRVYPPAWLLPRAAVEDDTVGGFTIPARSAIFCVAYNSHRHPDFWPDPDRFEPDRFEPAKVKDRHPYAHIPFGVGPNQCIGRHFAMLEIKVVLAVLMSHYRFELTPGQAPKPVPVLALCPSTGLRMSVHSLS